MKEFKVGDEVKCIHYYEDSNGCIFMGEVFIINSDFLEELNTCKNPNFYFIKLRGLYE